MGSAVGRAAWVLAPALVVCALALVAGGALGAADLAVADSDVTLGVRSPTQGSSVTVTATVHNNGDAAASNFNVRFTLDSTTTVADVAVGQIAAGSFANVTASWTVPAAMTGSHTFTASADTGAVVTEASESNNAGSHGFDVNRPPAALAAANATTQDSLVLFAFDSTGSTDPDGTIQSFVWVFDDGTTGTGATASHAFADGGAGAGKAYTVTLVVTDDDGGTASAQVQVLVTNRAPTAAASDVSGLTRTSLAFDGTRSVDLDGRIVNATWLFSDGRTLNGLAALRSFDDNGAYSATLTVRDEDGATGSVTIAVAIANQPPRAVVTTTPAMPFTAGQPALFDGRNSADVDGGIANYTWLFPGGVTVYGWNATTTFALNGTYNVTLVLVDDDGAVTSLVVVALVGGATGTRTPTPPVGRITASSASVLTAEVVLFDAGTSTDDTAIVSYLWDFGDGEVATGVVVTHAWGDDGIFVVTLNVTDTDGNSSFAIQSIRVRNRAPVAAASVSPDAGLTLTAFSFDASGSSDADGSILYYRWSFGDGEVLYGRKVDHTYTRPGTFTVTLTVTDNDGGEHSTSIAVAVNNRPPVAVPPAAFSVPTFEEHLFDGILSSDPDVVIQSYTWAFGDGTNASGRSVRHAYSTQGAKSVTLTVRDDFGATASATFTVTVTNNGPTATITGPTAVYTNQPADFAANAVDRDGSVATYAWSFGDGGTGSTASVSHTYTAMGTFTVTLVVTDNSGATGTASFGVRVLNRLPTATIASPTGAQRTAQSLTAITFSAEGSTDPETAVSGLQFFWIFGDGQVGSGLSVSHPFQRAGAFTVILTVSDGSGGAASATVPVVILNRAPTATVGVEPASADTRVQVNFTGAQSSDPDGSVTSYLWDFGDGSTSSERNPRHTYARAAVGGAYTVRLTVFDNLGANGSTTVQLTVNNRLPQAAFAFPDPIYGGLSTVLHGTSSSDADGAIVSWAWNFGDGSTGIGSEVAHQFPTTEAPASYVVTLTVTDDRGGTATASHNVTVVKKPVYDTGQPSGEVTGANQSPGFEGVLVAGALAAVAVVAARRRRA